MNSRKDAQLQFSIFSKRDTFAYNNIEKTPADFEHLKNVEITPGFDLGLNLSTTFDLTDYLLLILILLICITLFSSERDKGLTVLVRSTLKGRHHTAEAKLVALLLIVAGVSLVFYSADLITGELAFGLGELDRSIQSIPEFMNCTIKCTVFQYLILWLCQKVLTLCTVALLFAFFFIIIQSTNFTYVIITMFLGVEYILYNFIDSTSPVNHLKYINTFYYLSGNELLANYLNLDFFTQPVNVMWIYLFTSAFVALIITPLCLLVFSRQEQFAGNDIFAGFAEKIKKRIHISGGNTSVFRCECYKHYISSKAVIVIIFAMAFACFALTENIGIVYSNGAEVAYDAYIDKLEGEITPEKEQFLEDEQKYFDELNSQKADIEADASLTENEKNNQITAINNIFDTRGKGFENVILQYETIKSTGEKLNITPCFINYTNGKRLMADSEREWNLFFLLMVFMVFTISGVFAYERGKKELICATLKGKGRLFAVKFAVAFMTYSILYILIYLPYMINFLKTFGTDIFSNPLAFLEGFEGLESGITILEALLLEGLAHIVISFAVFTLILLLSDRLENTVATIIVSTAVTLIPCLLIYFNPDMRIFSLLMINKLYIIVLIIVLSSFSAVIFAVLAYKNFTGKVLWRCRDGVENYKSQ